MHKAEESKAAPQVSAASLQVHQGSQAQQCAVLLQHRASHVSVLWWRVYTVGAQALIKPDCCAMKVITAVPQVLNRIRQRIFHAAMQSLLELCLCRPAGHWQALTRKLCEREALQLSMPAPAKQVHWSTLEWATEQLHDRFQAISAGREWEGMRWTRLHDSNMVSRVGDG